MRNHRLVRLLAAPAALLVVLAGLLAAPSGVQASSSYTITTLHFLTHVGPQHEACDVVGDLYLPKDASVRHPVPAVLATNGFGGSKDDQDGFAALFASRDYAFLTYSGLGFGGSGCKITLDDPDYDGQAASQLISYLGGAPGIAFTDAAHTHPAHVLRSIVHDRRDHRGRARTYDPRVGMVGGSYGGGIQFATAADDARLDTIVPIITWNDLSYSLDPNNTDQKTGVSTTNPGAVKLVIDAALSALGVTSGFQHAPDDPKRLLGCPNFAAFVCPALVTAGATGYFTPSAVARFRHASVATYLSKVRIPTFLWQGENDTLFDLNEAAATYRALTKQGTPVKMIWQSWGHSGITPAAGEFDLGAPNPNTQYESKRLVDWFDHYLRGKDVSTGPTFSYFRDWVHYRGIASPAYATSSRYPVGTSTRYYLSGDSQLVTRSPDTGSQSFVTPPAGAPTSIDPVDLLGSLAPGVPTPPEVDAPGTAASWTGPVLTKSLDVAGLPTVHLSVSAPTAAASEAAGPAGQLVLFVKVLDVAPDGTASLIHGLVAPIRVADATLPFTVTLPGIVHRFAAGHSVRLVVAGGSENYRGGLTPTPVTVAGGTGQQLVLPTVK